MTDLYQAALDYHRQDPAGKMETCLSKPAETAEDLSLAYSPGVAAPVLEIAKDAHKAYDYTNKNNLVGVISNGSAILGLGNLGALASKPVMEGKALLFKRFGQVNAYDIEINEADPQKFIEIIKALAPTFGGINLEDIKAPECFEIEKALIEALDIPVFHDDQHGTAIIALAGLLNALDLQGKNLNQVKTVIVGAGSAGIAIGDLLQVAGMPKENIRLIDSKGVVHVDRTDLNPYKAAYAIKTPERTLADAVAGADVFIGVSQKDLLTPKMLKTMAEKPIIFALANPDPEIKPEIAYQTRDDIIMATGRSDYPNQVNNVLGFPYIFRGALDAKARIINQAMKLACAQALSDLAKEPVPQEVLEAYGLKSLKYGKNYILPKPTDPRLIEVVPKAIVKAAIDSGVAP